MWQVKGVGISIALGRGSLGGKVSDIQQQTIIGNFVYEFTCNSYLYAFYAGSWR